MPTSQDMDYKREEVRGLFVLGLLAVLVVVRFQDEKLMVTVGQSSLDFAPLVNITIMLWSSYAFFMVLGISDDVIGRNWAEMFRNLSRDFLRLDFILSGILGTLYFILGYHTRALWIIGFIVAISLFAILLSLRKVKTKGIKKKLEITRLDLVVIVTLLLLLIFAAALLLFPDERYLVVFFVLGLGSFIAFVLVKEKQSKEKNKPEVPQVRL